MCPRRILWHCSPPCWHPPSLEKQCRCTLVVLPVSFDLLALVSLLGELLVLNASLSWLHVFHSPYSPWKQSLSLQSPLFCRRDCGDKWMHDLFPIQVAHTFLFAQQSQPTNHYSSKWIHRYFLPTVSCPQYSRTSFAKSMCVCIWTLDSNGSILST